MLAQLLPALLAALVGVALGGSLSGLGRRIAWWPLGLATITLQLLLGWIPVTDQPWLATNGHWVWAAAVVAVLPVLVRNALIRTGVHRLPFFVASLGVALNVLVILANGGYMPVSQEALEQSGQSAALAARTAFHRDTPLDTTTRFPWLADILVDPAWMPRPLVASVGDRLLGLGLAGWAFMAVSSTRRRYAARALTGAAELAASHVSRTSGATGFVAR